MLLRIQVTHKEAFQQTAWSAMLSTVSHGPARGLITISITRWREHMRKLLMIVSHAIKIIMLTHRIPVLAVILKIITRHKTHHIFRPSSQLNVIHVILKVPGRQPLLITITSSSQSIPGNISEHGPPALIVTLTLGAWLHFPVSIAMLMNSRKLTINIKR